MRRKRAQKARVALHHHLDPKPPQSKLARQLEDAREEDRRTRRAVAALSGAGPAPAAARTR